jgi:hypothetical protein
MNSFLNFLANNAYSQLDVSEHQVDLQGWMCDQFEHVFRASLPDGNPEPFIIEVGTWKGLSTTTMARVCKTVGYERARILAIDTWLGAPKFWCSGLYEFERGGSFNFMNGYPTVFYTFTKNVKVLGHDDMIVPFPISSAQAPDVLRHYGGLADIIYIDASHEYDAVVADLRAYWPLLKEGGVMFGDDYVDCWPGVMSAVDEFAQSNGLALKIDGIVWSVRKGA